MCRTCEVQQGQDESLSAAAIRLSFLYLFVFTHALT